jgi:hypothetical protein
MSTTEQNNDSTSVEEVEINLDEILGTPGAENVMLPDGNGKKTEAKPNIFSSTSPDLSFIDNDSDDDDDESKEKKVDVDAIIKEADPEDDFSGSKDEEPNTEKQVGRPKIEKSGLAEVFNKMIEAGKIVPFDDDKPLEEYSVKDFEELIEANFNEVENRVRQETPQEFYDSLPDELLYAAKYVSDGGQDLKGLFKILSEVEEHRELNPKNERDQEVILREYLRATKFGNDDDIDEEILGWKDRGELEAKAMKFKPKLDKMQEQVVAQKVAQQEKIRKQQEAAAQHYMQNVYTTLQPGDLNGVKLDKKTQSMLYSGLVQPQYPSMSGRPTNLLGHLLEKYQYVEPRHDLIAEALWLLADPDGYKGKIRNQGQQQTVEKTVRQLKTEQAKMQSSTPVVEREETRQRRIPRNDNFFKR